MIIDKDYFIPAFYYFDTTMAREISQIGKNIRKLRK